MLLTFFNPPSFLKWMLFWYWQKILDRTISNAQNFQHTLRILDFWPLRLRGFGLGTITAFWVFAFCIIVWDFVWILYIQTQPIRSITIDIQDSKMMTLPLAIASAARFSLLSSCVADVVPVRTRFFARSASQCWELPFGSIYGQQPPSTTCQGWPSSLKWRWKIWRPLPGQEHFLDHLPPRDQRWENQLCYDAMLWKCLNDGSTSTHQCCLQWSLRPRHRLLADRFGKIWQTRGIW